MNTSSSHVSAESSLDYTFGFNNAKFSDRTLRITILPGSKPHPINNVASRARTRKRKHNHHHQDSNGCKRKRRCCPHQDSDNVHEIALSNENPSSKNYPAATQVKTITMHISTIVLAAKSMFFYKLFSNGMSESKEQHVTLHIQESEEVAFMDLLKFMYTNTLSSTTPSALLDVLTVADKYEVLSCTKYCCELLSKLPMTRESALLYLKLDLPSTNLMDNTVKPLTDAAKDFLVASFKEISKFEDEMLTLPLVGIEAILSSDDLQVNSEDFIYDFIIKWAQRHYTNLSKRREILTTRLLHLIRFPYMSCEVLGEVLTCSDINLEAVSKLVFEALSSKIQQQKLPCIPRERAYIDRLVKVIRYDSPEEMCEVYLDLKRDNRARLLPSCSIFSENFDLGGEEFYLGAKHYVDEQSSSVHNFGFYLYIQSDGPLGVWYEFSWRENPSKKFVGEWGFDHNFTTESYSYGTCNLFEVPWDTFIAEDSPYFINGVLHLKATIRIKKEL